MKFCMPTNVKIPVIVEQIFIIVALKCNPKLLLKINKNLKVMNKIAVISKVNLSFDNFFKISLKISLILHSLTFSISFCISKNPRCSPLAPSNV